MPHARLVDLLAGVAGGGRIAAHNGFALLEGEQAVDVGEALRGARFHRVDHAFGSAFRAKGT
jgi:hypothetical protein